MFSIFLLTLISGISAIWTLPFILLKLTNINLVVIKDDKKINKIMKNISNSVWNSLDNYEYGELKKGGFFFSRKFIGFIHNKTKDDSKEDKLEIYMLVSKKTLNMLLDNDNEEGIKCIDSHNDLYERSGNYFHLYYDKRKIEVSKLIPTHNQRKIIDDILDYYRQHKNCVSFVYGVPGSGKTTLAYLIAKELRGCICKTFKPFEPGDTLSKLVDRVSPTDQYPLIILLDEIDIILSKIHYCSIDRHKHIPISVYDKTTFNTFLDDMKYNKNIIILMTSNRQKEEIDALDKSYLRNGRVNITATLNE